ncbi:MAG TPA: hypothetical protein VH374_14450 [Polyangia bacterium]|jgi:hypothetical protein|nr:hypothetical protein [Polyangia bacterium]
MQMRVKAEVASPGVHHTSHAAQRPQAFRIAAELDDGFGGGREEQVQQGRLVLAHQGPQFGRQGEYDVKVADRQRALHARLDPSC